MFSSDLETTCCGLKKKRELYKYMYVLKITK